MNREKWRALFDSKITWATIGTIIAAVVGEPWTTAARYVGEAVMVIL